ncbi:MAG: GNAT family N-acetyltransferase [Bacteroidales bacterium]
MLKGNNIRLRALEPSDIDLLYAWENDEELWHLSNTITPVSRFILEQYILSAQNDIFSARQLRLMIEKENSINPGAIGTIDLFDFDPVNKRAGIGVLILRAEQKKGYASEALELLINYCFQILKLHQVYCNISVDNTPSIRLFEKHNFEVAGIKKEWIYNKGQWIDELILQLINK